MTMSPRVAKFALTAHVTSSVGWLGAVAAFLALAVGALNSGDVQSGRANYLAMEAIGWFVLVPLSLASLVTGLVQALGTKWGLFRHYWVVMKLFINVLSTGILVMYMQTLDYLANVAAKTPPPNGYLGVLRDPSTVVHSGAAIVLLLVATTLSVYKPRGMTPYGQRKQREHPPLLQP